LKRLKELSTLAPAVRIEADREVCIGAGTCALTAPEVFDQDADDGRVVLLVERPAAEVAAAAREAVWLCPSGALSLDEDDE
jgi:ferredoxin